MKTVRILGLGAVLALGATLAAAQPPATTKRPAPSEAGQADARQDGPRARGPRGPRGGVGGPLLAGITLSEAQREQVRAIGEKYRAQFRPDSAMGRARRDGATRQRPDSAARAEMRARMEQRRGEMQALRQQQETELRAVLTPEQQQTFDANRARLAERMSEPRGGRGRGMRPDGPRRDDGQRPQRGERPARPARG